MSTRREEPTTPSAARPDPGDTTMLDAFREAIEGEYRERTGRSRAVVETAREFVAGGVTRATTFWRPHPIVVERGEGCRLIDVDGNRYLDFNGNFTAALWGNDPPFVIEAIREAAPRLLAAGAATPEVHEWARLLCERYPTVERVRFCCSGTEAVLFGCRAARAASGRAKILKHRGSYHGTTDAMERDMPTSQLGIPPHAGADTAYGNLTDLAEAGRLLDTHRGDLAAVLLNPIWFSREEGVLPELVALARRRGVLVVADEVMSFRYAPGGAQEYFGFEADVTIFGKSIGGGGLAVGAFGGREPIMRLFSPFDHPAPAHHSGTFAGNPITAAAGIAALRHATPELFTRLASLGERLRRGFRAAFDETGIRAGMRGDASLVLLGLGRLGLGDPAPDSPAEAEVKRLFGLALLNRGLFTPADALIWAISAPMTETEIDHAVACVRDTLVRFRPVIESAAPRLLQTSDPAKA